MAYLLADAVDGADHVEQDGVIQGHARQGLGRGLSLADEIWTLDVGFVGGRLGYCTSHRPPEGLK